MILLPHIAAQLFDTPLMLDPNKAVAMMVGLGGRIVEGGIVMVGDAPSGETFAGKLSGRLGAAYEQQGRKSYDMVGAVAVIGVEGTLVHKGAYVGQSSGQTSYQGIQTQVAQARRDPQVKGVVLEIDSFGGQVAGAYETADQIAALSQEKPTLAILTDFGLSAGYLLGSAARQMVMPKTGAAGSIGVMALHRDISGKMEKDGEKITLVTSGAHKADGDPTKPLPDNVRAAMQARVDQQRVMFAEAVGKYRGSRLTQAKALGTEAQSFHGQDAVDAGLVDAVGPPQEAFAAFVKAINAA